MIKEKVLRFYNSHQGEVNGALIGLIASVAILIVGFFRVLFIAICIGIGYYTGKKLSTDKGYFKRLLDKILPPGTYR